MVGSLSSFWNDIGNANLVSALAGFLGRFPVVSRFSRGLTKTIWGGSLD